MTAHGSGAGADAASDPGAPAARRPGTATPAPPDPTAEAAPGALGPEPAAPIVATPGADAAPADARLGTRDVARAWWPLAASWLLMGLELPMVSAVIARLADPTIHLAAYGGVVFPISLLIESPVIMLLAASTAVCRDRASYALVRRYMVGLGLGFSGLHALVAFTPLFDLIAAGLLGVPEAVREPARLGLQVMTPWTASIAYRRFQQGVLIRFGHSRAVTAGTAVRLAANAVVLGAGLALAAGPGILVGTLAVACGVIGEALYAAWRVRPVLRDQMPARDPRAPEVTAASFLAFYVPLMVTPLFIFLAMPMASAGMSRMPRALESLAAWPALNGLVFAMRSGGFALNEVVVAQLERPGAVRALRRFALGLACALSGALLVLAATPLGRLWFERVAALPAPLVPLATVGLWLSFAFPAVSTAQSLWQGTLVHARRTRGVTESVLVFLAIAAAGLAAGAAWGGAPGLWVAAAAMVVGNAAQALWLRRRAAPELQALAGA